MFRIKGIPSQALSAILTTILLLIGAFTTSLYFLRSTFIVQSEVRDSYDSVSANRHLLDDIRDAETGQRGYLLTQDPTYLEPYTKGTANAPRDLERLVALTRDDPSQRETVMKLSDASHRKLDELARTIAVAASLGSPSALEIVKTNYGRDNMAAIRDLSAEIDIQQQNLLLARTAKRTLKLRIAIAGTTVFLGMTLLLAWTVVKAYRSLNAVLECTSDSVFTLGHDWKLLYGNQRALNGLVDFKVGADYWRCFPDLIGTETERLIRSAMRERTSVSFENFYAPYKAWYKGDAFPSQDGLSIFYTDITTDKEIQARLSKELYLREKRVEALSNMAGGLAHEISNPLAIIYARAADLKSEVLEGGLIAQNVIRACDNIVKTAERASAILRGLKGFTREASQDPRVPASIYRIVDECVLLQHSRFAAQNVKLNLDLAAGIPDVVCRETQIGQIITNLLNNSFDAVVQCDASSRWVSIQIHNRDHDVWIDVSDGGQGIDPESRAHLMEPFFTTKAVGGGTGIGLSLSRAIAIDHGGSLTLLEDTEHTCFRLCIPYSHIVP